MADHGETPHIDKPGGVAPLGPLGFGAGGLWASTMLTDHEAIALVETALDLGVRYFDTGPSYGAGRAEQRLGRALSGIHDVLISTKVGTHIADGHLVKDYSAPALAQSLELSLGRLNRDHVDVLLVHGPLDPSHVTDEILSTMMGFRDAGVAAAIGASCDGAVADVIVDSGAVDVIMTTISVLQPESYAVAKRAHDGGMIVIAKSPLGHAAFTLRGILPISRRRAWYLGRLLRHYPRQLLRGQRLGRSLARVEGETRVTAALRFLLGLSFVDTAVIGTTSAVHLRELTSAAERGPLMDEDHRAIAKRQEIICGAA